jgi:branched-chain amino acid transport system substrate-binding protein
VALVIGNAEYKIGPLQNPVHDAAAVAEILERKLGFDRVILRKNLGYIDFRAALIEMARESAGADLGVVYFAGHGTEVAGRNFLIPVDAMLAKASALDVEAIPLDTVLGQLGGVRKLKLVILDACRNNLFVRAGGKRSVSRGLARIEPEDNTMVVYAAKHGTTADDGTGREHSPFTNALLKHIATPGLEISLLFRRVRDDVMKATSHEARPQQPHVYASLGGQELYLRPPSSPAVAPVPTPAPSRAEVAQFCQSVAANTSIAVVQSLLDAYRGTPMGTCAEARLKELRQVAAAAPPPAAKPAPAPAATPAVGTFPPAPPPLPSGTVKIAVAGPMTGHYAAFGAQLRLGAEQAVDDINAAGGVLGRKIRLEVGDDVCNPTQARAVAEKLASMKVPVVIGHFCSSSSIPASDAYHEAGILQISPASTNPQYTDRGFWNTFRVCGRDDQQGQVAGKYLAKAFKGKSIAILHDKSTYGKGLADETKKTLNRAGVREKLYQAYTQGEKDFTALVSRMKAANIDAVYVGGYHTEAGLILRQMRDRGVRAQLVSGDALVTSEFWAITGPIGAGVRMTFGADPRKRPSAAAVVRTFRDKGHDPVGYTVYTYAALQIWAQATKRAGTVEPKRVAETMRAGAWDTVLGPIGFDRKGDITTTDYVLYRWKNDGTYAEVGDGT